MSWALFGSAAFALTGCSGSTLPVTLNGAVNVVQASGVSCSPSNGSVEVAGTLTAISTPPTETSEVSAEITDSSGKSIGTGETDHSLTMNNGDSASFDFTISVEGTPASCVVQWGALNSTAFIPTS